MRAISAILVISMSGLVGACGEVREDLRSRLRQDGVEGSSSTPAGSPLVGTEGLQARVIPNVTLIGASNRREFGKMYGYWGPHLRSMYLSESGERWYAMDEGTTVASNPKLGFYRQDGAKWVRAAAQGLSGVQQAAAHVTDGSTIFSYGVSRPGNGKAQLLECQMDMTKAKALGCSGIKVSGVTYEFASYSNYVGAASLGKKGARIVWFLTTPDPGSSDGKFTYLANYGSGWNGPFVTSIVGNDALSYLNSQMTGDGALVAGGSIERAHNAARAAALARDDYMASAVYMDYANRKSAIYAPISYKGNTAKSSMRTTDLFFDEATKTLHVLVAMLPAPLADRKGVAACTQYDKDAKVHAGKQNSDLTAAQKQRLDASGQACVDAVVQKVGKGRVHAYGKISLADLKAKMPVVVEFIPELVGFDRAARFALHEPTGELRLFVAKRLDVELFNFGKGGFGSALDFASASRTTLSLSGLLGDATGIGSIQVPRASYSSKQLVKRHLEADKVEFAVIPTSTSVKCCDHFVYAVSASGFEN